MKVHILGSIGTGWGSYVRNLLDSMSGQVEYTFPRSWLSYWQFQKTGLSGEARDSFTLPVSSGLRKIHLVRRSETTEFPKLEIVRAAAADVVHSNCRFLSSSRPYVLVFDTPWLLTTFRTYSGEPTFGRVGKIIVKHVAMKKCLKILPFSKIAKKQFIHMTGLRDDEEMIDVLPPGVQIPRSVRSMKKRESGDEFRLLFIGRNFDRKGGPILLRSFEMLASEFSNLRLTIKTRTRGIDVPSKIRERVQILDTELPREELISMYVNSDLLVLPSLQEAFGLVCIEAMSYGLPVVASNYFALPEIVDDGVTGSLFETGHSEDLAKKVRVFVRDPGLANDFGAAGLARARKQFSNEAVNAKLFQIYEKCGV